PRSHHAAVCSRRHSRSGNRPDYPPRRARWGNRRSSPPHLSTGPRQALGLCRWKPQPQLSTRSGSGLDQVGDTESFRKSQPNLVKRYEEATPDGPAHFPVVFEKTKRLWLTEPDIQREELTKITAPTLVMVGDRDAGIPEHTLELFRSIKGAQLCVIPETTHFLLDR